MLIDSPRFKRGDRERWDTLERYDQKLAGSRRLIDLERQAVNEIVLFLDKVPDAFVSMSWGKDSVVVAHLAHLANPRIPLKAARVADWEPPETDWTRDAYLEAHGSDYLEKLYQGTVPQRGEPGFEEIHADPGRKSTNIMSKLLPPHYISGVRAEESKIRAESLKWHGVSTNITCRPIIRWTAVDVFAYLSWRRLPVHPNYAMSYAGLLDRRWLRVHILGSIKAKKSAVYGRDMSSWEDDYYGDVLEAARTARTPLWREQSALPISGDAITKAKDRK